MTDITVGADPELFVVKKGRFVSGHDYVFGTKRKPKSVLHGFIQNDGVALEINVKPASNVMEFCYNTTQLLADLQDSLRQKDKDAKVITRPSIFLGHKRISKLPPEAAELGCSPDYNGWTGDPNPTPDGELPFRAGAGHIHVGWTKNANPRDNKHFALCCILAKQMDYFLGLPSLLWDKDNRRRKMYGKAGAFRPKPYGMEYRVLSNKWLETRELMAFVFNRTLASWRAVESDNLMEATWENLAQELINKGDRSWRFNTPELAAQVLVRD